MSIVTWCIILLEAVIRKWMHCGHKVMDIVTNNTQIFFGVTDKAFSRRKLKLTGNFLFQTILCDP